MTEEQKICFLKDEYLKLQDQYEDFDRRSLTIKGWISAGAIAAIAIGLDPGKTGGESIWLVVMISAACFWYLEAKWKLFQYALSDRIRMIEAHFRGDQDILIKELYPFQIYNWWSKTHQYDMPIYPYERDFRPKDYWKRFRSAAFQEFVMLPYILMIAAAIIGIIYNFVMRLMIVSPLMV